MFTNCTPGHVKRTVNRNDRNVMTLFGQPWSAEIDWVEEAVISKTAVKWIDNDFVLMDLSCSDKEFHLTTLKITISCMALSSGQQNICLTKVLFAAYAFKSISKTRMYVTMKSMENLWI